MNKLTALRTAHIHTQSNKQTLQPTVNMTMANHQNSTGTSMHCMQANLPSGSPQDDCPGLTERCHGTWSSTVTLTERHLFIYLINNKYPLVPNDVFHLTPRHHYTAGLWNTHTYMHACTYTFELEAGHPRMMLRMWSLFLSMMRTGNDIFVSCFLLNKWWQVKGLVDWDPCSK